MDRLTINFRPKTAEKEKCLPAGDGLPSWSTLPLCSKFPMVPNPKGSITLCTTKLCEPKHKIIDFDFDLSDPYGYVLTTEYQPLHDPHLKRHFSLPRMQRHLRKNGFITETGQVICNLKEFNQYRQYLRRICLLELRNERKEQQEKEKLNTCSSVQNLERPNSRGDEVRKRLQQMRQETKARIERDIKEKANRLERRLNDIHKEITLNESRRQEVMRKRHAAVVAYHNQILKHNSALVRKWKQRDRQHLRRLDNMRRARMMKEQQKRFDNWTTRKTGQKLRIEREEEILRMERIRREKNILERDRILTNQRNILYKQLKQLQDHARKIREEQELKHKERLMKRLAIANLKMMNKKRRGRRGRHTKLKYESLWTLEDTLQKITLSDINFTGKKSSGQFLKMLNETIDEQVNKISIEEIPCENDYENVDEKAKEIVDNVIASVRDNIYPEYLRLRQQEQEEEKLKVHFNEEQNAMIPSSRAVDRSILKPVSDHVLTPVASPCAVRKLSITEKMSEKKLVENLLNRLLDDLNRGRLSTGDLTQLTKYSMDILSKRTFESEEIFDITGLADEIVSFTLIKVLNDIKSGALSQEEVTDMAASLIRTDYHEDMSILSASDDEQLQNYIDETIEAIVHDRDTVIESPVNDSMLDEWIVSTLKEIADDVDNGRLSKGMVAQMISMLSTSELKEKGELELRPFLEHVIAELKNNSNTSLYKVVHAIVSSYHAYKAGALESFTELITMMLNKLQKAIDKGELSEDDVNVEMLYDSASKLSSSAIGSVKMSDLALNVSNVFEDRETSNIAEMIVENVLEYAKNKVLQSDNNELRHYANAMTTSLKNITAQSDEDEGRKTPISPPFIHNVTCFVVYVLKFVWNSLEHNGFTDKDVQDMAKIITIMIDRENLSPDSNLKRESLLIRHIQELLKSFESGQFDKNELYDLGKSLVQCGKRLLGQDDDDSLQFHSRLSLTSSAVASDDLSRIMFSIQDEIMQGLISNDGIKELAKCILETRISQHTCEQMEKDQENASPCDSLVAEEFVRETLGDVVRDLESGSMIKETLSSMAASVASVLSLNKTFSKNEKFDAVVKKIIRIFKEDKLSTAEIKTVFGIILEHYTMGAHGRDASSSYFPDGEMLSDESLIAECLIRETISKLERDIDSGRLSDDDIFAIVKETKEKSLTQFQVQGDICNLTIAIFQQFLFDLNTGKVPREVIYRFLAITANDEILPAESSSALRKKIRTIMSDINLNKGKSQYVRNIVNTFTREERGTKTKQCPQYEPIVVLQHVIENIHPNILSNFVRVTLRGLLEDFKDHQPSTGDSQAEYLLQSASSSIANKVVNNLLEKLQQIILTEGSLLSNEQLRENVSDVLLKSQLSSIPSLELNSLILDTLNNIISNVRLERSLEKSLDSQPDLHVSSQHINDFVLEKLQEIVESLQDSLTFEGQIQSEKDDREKHDSHLFDDKEAKALVSESLKSVVSNIAAETDRAKTQMSMGKSTSTSSLEAEAIVIEALHDMMQQIENDGVEVRGFERDMKEDLIFILENFRDDIYVSADVYDALQNIFKPVMTMKPTCSDGNMPEIEAAMDTIIENVKSEAINAQEVFRVGEEDNSELSKIANGPSVSFENLGRPQLSLQKMTDMTKEMVKVYNDLQSSKTELNKQETSSHNFVQQASSDIVEIATEVLERTISNISQSKLSNEEILTLASAISDSNHDQTTTSTDKALEDYIITVLQNVLETYRENGIDPEYLPVITERVFRVNDDKKPTGDITTAHSRTSISSGIITDLVTDVLGKIAKNMSEESVRFTKQKVSDCSSVDTKRSFSSSSRCTDEGNVRDLNPNAASKCISAQSLNKGVGPPRHQTPTALVQSFHDVVPHKTNKGSAQTKLRPNQRLMTGNGKIVKTHTTIPNRGTPDKNRRQILPAKVRDRKYYMSNKKQNVEKDSNKNEQIAKRQTNKAKQNENVAAKLSSQGKESKRLPSIQTMRNNSVRCYSKPHQSESSSKCSNKTNVSQISRRPERNVVSRPQQLVSLCGSFKLMVKTVSDENE